METYKIGENEYNDFETFGRRCGCPRPSYVERNQVATRREAFQTENSEYGSITAQINIPVGFIHITDGSSGHISSQARHAQIDVLNTAFTNSKITFFCKEDDTITIDNRGWFRMRHNSAAEREAKSQLGRNQESMLNFYTVEGGGLLGWATFPWELEGDPAMDGIVVTYSSLPDMGQPPYNLGQTATHEVGHWLGLYHTFQGGCNSVGDHVGDTVAHSGPNYGKPEVGLPHNACVLGELAPVKNFMNYVDDDWMEHFTVNQIKRMRDMIGIFRPELLAPTPAFANCKRVSRVL